MSHPKRALSLFKQIHFFFSFPHHDPVGGANNATGRAGSCRADLTRWLTSRRSAISLNSLTFSIVENMQEKKDGENM